MRPPLARGSRSIPRQVTALAAIGFGLSALAPAASALPPSGLASMLTASEPAPSAVLHRVAVFGADNRTRLPKRLEGLRASIGLIYNERTRTVCSAFCVADDVIATASHCVFRTKGETPPPPEQFYFSRPGTPHASARIAGAAAKATGQHIVAGAFGISTKPPIEAALDWALIKLQSPACRGKALPVTPMTPSEIEREATAGRVYQAAFHRDFGRWSLSYSEPCFAGQRAEPNASATAVSPKDFTDPLNLVLHTCDTGGASSGSPLLIETPSGPQAVAINVGTFVQSRVFTEAGVVRRTPAAPVANTAVSAVAFAAKLEALRNVSVLTSQADLRALQNQLWASRDFDGAQDGRFGSPLRAAIEAYEMRNGLPVLGLPTRALLDSLSRTASGR